MFKKIAALAVTFACVFSFMASATFLDDNPRFVQVGHDDTTESYIDMNTIQSVRYDPPYYIIRSTVVTYDYANNTVQGYDNNFFYNFKAQTVKTQTLAMSATICRATSYPPCPCPIRKSRRQTACRPTAMRPTALSGPVTT